MCWGTDGRESSVDGFVDLDNKKLPLRHLVGGPSGRHCSGCRSHQKFRLVNIYFVATSSDEEQDYRDHVLILDPH